MNTLSNVDRFECPRVRQQLELYREQVFDQKGRAGRMRRRFFRMFVIINIIVSLFALCSHAGYRSMQEQREFYASLRYSRMGSHVLIDETAQRAEKARRHWHDALVNVLFMACFVTFSAIGLAILHPTPRVAVAIRRGLLVAPTSSGSRDLAEIVQDLWMAMEIEGIVDLRIARRDNSCTPSLFVINTVPTLVVPLGMLKYMRKGARYRSQVRAMLAHEFGHIYQQDARLWPTLTVFASNLRLVMWLSTVGAVVWGAVVGVGGSLSMILIGFCTYSFYRDDAVRARRESENLADHAAAIFANGHDLADALEALVVDKKQTFVVHPPLVDRVLLLRGYAERMGDTKS